MPDGGNPFFVILEINQLSFSVMVEDTDQMFLYYANKRNCVTAISHMFHDLITYFSRRSDGRSRGNRKSDLPRGGRDDHTGHWG